MACANETRRGKTREFRKRYTYVIREGRFGKLIDQILVGQTVTRGRLLELMSQAFSEGRATERRVQWGRRKGAAA
jgi:hypothetical protein